jgi:HlyD family secretion protein
MVARHVMSGGGSGGARTRKLVAAVALVGTVGIGVVACSAAQAPEPITAKVERASVSMGVSAPGALSSLTEQNLGFAKGGQITQLFVKVGDKVEAGQPLAAIDDFPAKQVLAQQTAQLGAQQAALDKLTSSPVVEGAENTLAQAQQVLSATEGAVDALVQADEVAIHSAERQLDADEDALHAAEAKLASDKCPGAHGSDDDDDDVSASSASTGSDTSSSGLMTSPCPADQQAVAAAKQKVVASKGALDAAKQKRQVDEANGQVQIENARQGVVTAQNNADSSGSDRPHNIDQQAALVASTRALVEQAQRDVDNCTLKAPVAGTVSVLNGAVGEFLAPSNGTSALAPGSGASIPGASGSTGGGAAAAATGASPSRPGGTQFLVLNNIDEFQVVVPFNESDAASIQPNQRVDVTFDAIPDLTASGTVVAVAPQGTSIAGVISYYVTIAVTTTDPRMKGGQTATAKVVTSETPNVLTVPSSAVRQVDGRSVVSVVGPSGPVDVPFQPGVVGLDRTEVVSGLQEGQQVLLPVGQR